MRRGRDGCVVGRAGAAPVGAALGELRAGVTQFGFAGRFGAWGCAAVGLLVVLLLLFPGGARAARSWSAPIEIDPNPGFPSVACPSASQCTAVDFSGNEVTFNPTSPGTPAPATIDNSKNNELNAVACPSVKQCTAVDSFGDEVTFNPTSPGALISATAVDSRPLEGVGCPSLRQCTAVDTGGRELTFDPALAGAPTLALIDTNGLHGAGLDAVACPSANQCTAVDDYGGEVTFNPISPGRLRPTAVDPQEPGPGRSCVSLCQPVHGGRQERVGGDV